MTLLFDDWPASPRVVIPEPGAKFVETFRTELASPVPGLVAETPPPADEPED